MERNGICISRGNSVSFLDGDMLDPDEVTLTGLSTTLCRPYELDDSWEGVVACSVYIAEFDLWIFLSEREFSSQFIEIYKEGK